MTRLLWLPDALRDWGLTVVEHPGWATRGAPFTAAPRVVVGHHTATPLRAVGDFPTLRLLVDGRSDLDGPLSQVGISRSGIAHVLASGKANHAGKGEWRGTTASSLTVGTEVEHPGVGTWTPRQLRAFDRSQAAILQGLGLTAADYCGHREWALPRGRKVDPGGVDLNRQRDRIAALLNRGPLSVPPNPTPAPPTHHLLKEDPDMFTLIRRKRDGLQALIAPARCILSPSDPLIADYRFSGLVRNDKPVQHGDENFRRLCESLGTQVPA